VIDQIDKDWEGNRNCFGPRLHEFIHALTIYCFISLSI
jgi:hypothetical protein